VLRSSWVDCALPALGTHEGEHPRVMVVELSDPILSEPSRTDAMNKLRIENRQENHLMLLSHLMYECDFFTKL
jgi:hypothetical protein